MCSNPFSFSKQNSHHGDDAKTRRFGAIRHSAYLHCCHTRCYFKDGAWTEDPGDATCFAAEVDAVRAGVVNNLQNVELVLSTPNTLSRPFNSACSLNVQGLPGLDGFELLTWLRHQPELNYLPVVVIAGSAFSRDVTRAYQLGANSFVVKPSRIEDYTAAIKQVTDFWLKACELPDAPADPGM